MTRFARAKGSKASNERLPEEATPWGELKEQLIKKNNEKDNKEAQEKAFEQRNANYKAFLKEREEEEAKNMSWAEFPGNDSIGSLSNKRKHSQVDPAGHNNRKIYGNLNDNQDEPTSVNPKTKKAKKLHTKNEQNSPNFNDLKKKLDKVLDSPTFKDSKNNSDSDAPPDEASARVKPQEIVAKKTKIKKPLLKIVTNRQEKFDNNNSEVTSESPKKTGKKQDKLLKDNDKNKAKIAKQSDEELSEKSLLKIQKKKERYQKQLEKKKLKKSEQKIDEKNEENGQDELDNQNDKKQHNLATHNTEKNIAQGDGEISEKSLLIIQKKKEKKQKKLEKKKLKKMEQTTNKEVSENGEEKSTKKKRPKEPEYDNENLTEKQLLKIKKKKERRARQKEKRQQLRERKQQALTNETNNQIKNEQSSKDKKEQNSENQKTDKNNLTAEDLVKIQKKKEKLAKQAEKRKKSKEEKQKQQESSQNNNNEETKDEKPKFLPKKDFGITNGFKTKPIKNKFKDDKEHQRRKPLKPEKMFINGKEIEIDYIDNFPVKKEDADRIRQLRKDMINKGLPRSEIDVALKLERRRAEKALAREKKNVCFNCRNSGHNLSECPELGTSNQMVQSSGTGICFKCGSTEHTHFECRVERGDVYKYASCFICNEQGHIAKQCPDNQRGLYPKGGSCKVCGDVTHLKKDCPKYQAQQQHLQNSLSVGTMDNTNPDLIEGVSSNKSWGIKGRVEEKLTRKVVKF